MTPRTTPIICAKAPRHIAYVPAVREPIGIPYRATTRWAWRCSWCGARVKVVA